MTRDMDMIRKILAEVEARGIEHPDPVTDPNFAYQVALMKEAGLVDAAVVEDDFGLPRTANVIRLTWDGHDFLDASRDSKIWKMAKEHIIKPGASWTFSMLVEWLKLEARRRVFGDQTSSCDSTPPHVV